MKNTFQQVLATYGKQVLAAVLTFILLQYSHGLNITDIPLDAILSAFVGAIASAVLKFFNVGNAFFDTWYGNLIKTAGTVILSLISEQIISGQTLFTIHYADLLNTAFATTIPTIINFLNKNDDRYGLKKD